jgi:NAD(P)-dependent dehydrogenase (short-subunit alcohol dehydrogenase family)
MRLRNQVLIGLLGAAGAAWAGRAWLRSRRRIELTGRVVVVTGASSGLGLLIAREAAARGAKLVLAARSEPELEAIAAEFRAGGVEAVAVPTDVSDEGQARRLIDRAVDRFGRVDVLINAAGVMLVGPAETMDAEDFRRVIATNFWGELYPTLATLPRMRRQGFGRIANVISVGGKVAVPHMLAYSASKFALTGLTEGLRAELASQNILVTGVYPGTIRTGGHVHAEFKGDAQAEYTWFALSDVIPGVAASAHHAARAILDAVEVGDPEVVIGWNARLAILAHNLFPGWTVELLGLLNQALPSSKPSPGPAIRGSEIHGAIPDALNRLIPSGTRAV